MCSILILNWDNKVIGKIISVLTQEKKKKYKRIKNNLGSLNESNKEVILLQDGFCVISS